MKKTKIPSLFKKRYKEKAFNRKILKRIHIPKDREKIANLFKKDENSRFVLIGNIPDETLQTLQPLAKSIKKNRGFVSTWKTAIALIFVGFIVVFNFFYKDKLIERALESGLESIFLADADLKNPHVSLLKGLFTFESITIADADKPLFNLIEAGRAEFKISTGELMFKRVHIDEVSIDNILWNTKRNNSGSLTRDQAPQEGSTVKESTSLFSNLSFNAGDFDYQSIINNQKENLQLFKLVKDSNQHIREIQSRWTGILNEKETEIKKLSDNLNSVRTINVNNIKSISEAQSLVTQVQSFYPEAEKIKKSTRNLNRDFDSEKKQILSIGNALNSAVEADLVFLVDSMDLSLGDLQSIASDLAEDYIRARWNSYYEKGLKVWDLIERFQNRERKEGGDKVGINRSSGRNIPFPSAVKPTFFISHLGLTGGDETSGHLSMDVTSITNEPDKTSDPVEFDLTLTRVNQILNLNGIFDLKKDSEVLFQMNMNVPDYPVELEQGIPTLGISSLSSDADILGSLWVVRGESSLHIELDVLLSEIKPVQSERESFLSDTVRNLFNSPDDIGLTGDIVIDRKGIESVSVQSDFDTMIYNSLGGYLIEQKGKIAQEFKNNLLRSISSELENNERLLSSLDNLGIQSLNQLASINQLEEELDGKISELENKGNAIVSELKNEAGNLLDKAKDKIKLPGF